MRMRRMGRLGVLGGLAVLVLGLWSCAPAGIAGDQVIGMALRYDKAAPVAKGKLVELTFWTQVDYEDIYRTLVDDYQAMHPNVTISLVAFDYNDYFNTIGLALESGIGPDIFHMHNKFTEQLWDYIAPYPAETMPLETLVQDFRQVGSHVKNGEVKFFDTVLMSSAILFNKEHWQEAGLGERDIPQTWDELVRVARVLTLRDAGGEVVRAGFNPNGIGFSLFTAMNLQKGTYPLRPNGASGAWVDTPAARASMAYLQGLYGKDGVASTRMAEFHESFGVGESSMVYAWGWVNNWLAKNFPDLEWGSFPTPTWQMDLQGLVDRNNGEASLCVSAGADGLKQEVAFDVVRYFLANDDYLLEVAKQFSSAPSKRSLDSRWEAWQAAQGRSLTFLTDRTVWPGIVPERYEELLSDLLIDPVIIDHVPLGQALADCEAEVERLVEAGGTGKAGW